MGECFTVFWSYIVTFYIEKHMTKKIEFQRFPPFSITPYGRHQAEIWVKYYSCIYYRTGSHGCGILSLPKKHWTEGIVQ